MQVLFRHQGKVSVSAQTSTVYIYRAVYPKMGAKLDAGCEESGITARKCKELCVNLLLILTLMQAPFRHHRKVLLPR